MPFDASTKPTRRLDQCRATRAQEASDILSFVHQKYASHEWRWKQGLLSDGRGGYCLRGAVLFAGIRRRDDYPSIDRALHYLARAIRKCVPREERRELSKKYLGGNDGIVVGFNNSRTFEAVMDVISIAMHIADTDAGRFGDAV